MQMQVPTIVMLTYGFYPPEIGGVEVAVYNYARILTEKGHRVYVIAPMKEDLAEMEIVENIHVHRFPLDWREAEKALIQNSGIQEFRSKIIQSIESILNEIKQPFIIHAHGETIILAGWLKEHNNRLKIVFSPHGSPEYLKMLSQLDGLGLYFRDALEKADIIAYQNIHLIKNMNGVVDHSKIREMINFVDLSLFNPSKYDIYSSRKTLKLPKNAKIIFSPTRVDEGKGLVELVHALPIILQKQPNAYLYIAGDLVSDGFMIEPAIVQRKLKRIVRKKLPEFTDHVRFIGAIPNHEMPNWYSASDIIVLISRDECQPMCILEAMAMEKPIVASKVGGVPKLLDDYSGQLIEVKPDGTISPNTVAAAIIEELSKSKDRRAYLKRAREKIVQHFSPEVGYQKLKAIYSELANQI